MIREMMRTDFAIATPDESLASARETMRLGRLRHLLVTRDGALIGLLSYRDLLERLCAADGALPGVARVADVMQRAPTCVAPETSLGAAADRMCRYGLGCLPVVERDRLVGIVTESDLLRAAFRLRPA